MFFLRFLVILVLVWCGWRIYTGWTARQGTLKKSDRVAEVKDATDDILEEDPVCGKLVPRSEAVRLQIFERSFYFCSKECCQAFRKEKGESS